MRKTEHPLRTWRHDNGWSLDDLAEEVGLSNPHLSLVERGLKGLSLGTAVKLSKFTGLPLEAFVREDA